MRNKNSELSGEYSEEFYNQNEPYTYGIYMAYKYMCLFVLLKILNIKWFSRNLTSLFMSKKPKDTLHIFYCAFR